MPSLDAYRASLNHSHEYHPLTDGDDQTDEIEHCSCGSLRRRLLRDDAREDERDAD